MCRGQQMEPDLSSLTYRSTEAFKLDIKRVKIVKVYDGDTVTAGWIPPGSNCPCRVSCRIARVDTPEMRSKCPLEKAAAGVGQGMRIFLDAATAVPDIRKILERDGRGKGCVSLVPRLAPGQEVEITLKDRWNVSPRVMQMGSPRGGNTTPRGDGDTTPRGNTTARGDMTPRTPRVEGVLTPRVERPASPRPQPVAPLFDKGQFDATMGR